MLDESFLLVLAPKLYNEAFWHALHQAPQITNFIHNVILPKEGMEGHLHSGAKPPLGGQGEPLNKL